MRLTDTITLEVKNNNTWVDYSEGITGLGVLRGVQGYQAIWQTPEAGVLTIITRNPNVDPYGNEDIRMGRDIRVKANNNVLFTGRITDINVDYQPKGKPPVTTLTAVDMIGTMALHALSDGFTERLGDVMDIYGLFQELEITDQTEIIGWNNPHREGSALWFGNASEVTASGSTALSVAKILAQTQIQFFYADRNNDMYLYNRMNKKRNDAIKLQFDSRGGATSYKEIELTDNFETLTNQLSIRNQGYNSNIVPLYTNQYSKNEWGQAKKDFTVQISALPAAQSSITNDIKDVIFQDSVHPSREIYSITWDGTLNTNAAATIDILDNVFVYHEVDPEDISRKYGIIGIEHKISDDEWTVKYYLKNHFIYDTNFPTPVIQTNHPLGGTINDDITFSVANAADIDLTSGTYSWRYEAGTLPIQLVGNVFSTSASPTVNYGPTETGVKNIRCTVTDSYGFTKQSNILSQQVSGAAPTAVTTSYTINQQDTAIYTFTATTTDATSYTFHWGDGTTYTTTQTSATHRYSTTGNKSVYVVANNGFGSTQSATTVINVAFTPFPAAQVGTWGLRYVALASPYQNLTGTGTVIPVYGRLQLNTSNAPAGNPSTDPQVNRALVGSYQTVALKEPYSTQPSGNNAIANPTKINIQSGQSSIADWTYWSQTISGAFHNSYVFDMGAAYYDIDNIKITFKNISTTQTTSHTFNVWVTDNVEETFDFNTSNWYKIGTIYSGVLGPNAESSPSIVLDSSIPSLPLNLQPFPAFTYTIGNTSENIQGDKYTFSTGDFYTASYLWNFGDGTTSTLQNPIKTWSSSGSKTVTLTKYDQFGNAYSSSQTFTVTRIADQIGTTPVRYIKLKQNTFNATALRYSPLIGDFRARTSATNIDRAFQKPIKFVTPTNVEWWSASTTGAIPDITTSTFAGTLDGNTLYYNTKATGGYNNAGSWAVAGWEPRAVTTGNTSFEWVIDLGQPRYDITYLSFRGNRNGVGTSTSTRPTYEVYFSSDNVNWTKVANLSHSSSMTNSGQNGWYSGNITMTQTLPLSI
jgi:hypothetical protein